MRLFTCTTRAVLIGAALASAAPASAAITFKSDPIIFWNDVTLSTLITPTGPLASPLFQTRGYAMVNIAMHDAVNAATGGTNRSYLSGVTTSGGDSRAAASQAAYSVLVALNPGAQSSLQTALDASLAEVLDPVARAQGIATGQAYAAAIMGLRANDKSTPPGSYTSTGLPGDWRPTGMAGAAAPHWGGVTPFILNSGNQFSPGAPPARGSDEYADAYNEVRTVGSVSGQADGFRTQDQTDSALFWDAANGQPWLRIGVAVAADETMSTLQFASAFALLTSSMADALIAGFDAKYTNRLWRPITAIQLGEFDGNDATVGDPGWNSLFPAPSHPSYVSTHSALSGAGSTILDAFFGDDEGFTITIDGTSRKFDGLAHAAEDGANSRLWGGIHFRFDNDAGLKLGQDIAQFALDGSSFDPVPEPATWGMMIAGFALVGGAMRRQAARVRFVTA